MPILVTITAALLGLLQPSRGAAQDSEEWWADAEVVGTGESCASAYPDNPFADYMNCWLPVFEGRSSFYIKKHDHKVGRGRGQFFSNEGWSGSMPVEVWVLGFHRTDASVRYRKSMSLYRLSCQRNVARFAVLKFVAHSATGEVLEDRETSTAKMRVAVPGSKEEAFAQFVCGE